LQQDLWHTFSGRQHSRSPGVQMSFVRLQHTPLQLFPLAQQTSSLVQRVPFRQHALKQTFSGRQHVLSFGVHVNPGQHVLGSPGQEPPSTFNSPGAHVPPQHVWSAVRQHAVLPHFVVSTGQVH
jgi:hypothetical protein